MSSKDDASCIVTAISYLSGYLRSEYQNPAKIDELLETAGAGHLRTDWQSVRKDLEEIYLEQKRASRILSALKTVSDAAIYAYFGSYVLAILFNIIELKILIINPFALAVVVVVAVSYPIYKQLKKGSIERASLVYVRKSRRVRDLMQDLILLVCNKLRIEKKDPRKYRMKLDEPDYRGIMVIGKPSFFGGDYYTAFPSIVGAVATRAKEYIKVVEPWATEKEVFESLFKLDPSMQIKVLISDEIGESERFRKTWSTVREQAVGNFQVLCCKLDELSYRLIITKSEAWRATGKEWETLVDVKDLEKKQALEKAFDEKWKDAQPIRPLEKKKKK